MQASRVSYAIATQEIYVHTHYKYAIFLQWHIQ